MISKYNNFETVKKIRIRLIELNKNEEELYSFLNWTRQTWYRKVQGGSSFSLNELQKIAEYLECDVSELV